MSRLQEVVKYVTAEIYDIVSNVDWLSDSEKQKALIEIDRLLNDLGLSITQIVPLEIANAYIDEAKETFSDLVSEGLKLHTTAEEYISSILNKSDDKVRRQVERDMFVDLKSSQARHNRALNNIVEDSMLDLNAAIRTARESATRNITKTLDSVHEDIAKGLLDGDPRRVMKQRVMESFQNDGLTAFITIDNKKLPLDFYSETVVNTKVQTARNHANLNMIEDYRVKHAYVTGNEPTCGVCARYRGFVYSVDGKDDRFPHIDLYKLFPLHPHCKCKIRPYVIKYRDDDEVQAYIDKTNDFDPETDPRSKKRREAYENDQKKKRIARQEMKTYAYIKSALGNDAPKNIGAYRRMKRTHSVGYEKMMAKLKEIAKAAKA